MVAKYKNSDNHQRSGLLPSCCNSNSRTTGVKTKKSGSPAACILPKTRISFAVVVNCRSLRSTRL